MGQQRLDEIATLIESLKTTVVGSHTSIEVDHGRCEGTTLLDEPAVSVHVWDVATGTEFQSHCHYEREWIIVVSGEMRIRIDDDEFAANGRLPLIDGFAAARSGDEVFVPARTEHEAIFPTASRIISVHIPRSKEYAGE